MESTLPNELSARVKFTDVVKRFEKISATKDNKTKAELVSKFFKSIYDLQERFRNEVGPDADASFYPFLRLFVPYKDSERGSYGIQTTTLGRLYVKAIAVNPKSQTALKLTNLQGNTADYGDIVCEVMKNRSPDVGKLTVYEVNKYLDLIADHFKQNERNQIDTEIVKMFMGMSAVDRKWLTRILLKKLKLGIGDKRLLELYNPRAYDLYVQCNHLSDVCKAIETNTVPVGRPSNDGTNEASLGEASNGPSNGLIQIFRPLRPMLCERGYISQINKMLAESGYYLETKMDGERCQVHVDGTQFKYYSRGCKDDLTQVFGSSDRNGLFSPFFHRQLSHEVKNAIFDGEMMVWDNEDDTFLKKSENFTAKYLKQSDHKQRACYCIYDLIYLNGKSLTEIPYAERIRRLKGLIQEQKGALVLCERTKIVDSNHFLECLNKAFDANEEGVVIKQEDSKYHPGKRERGGWFKMKPDYENGIINDFDLTIIGGYYNDNRTAIDSFLLAVLKKGEAEGDPGVFHAVCKIRNGLTRANFRTIAQKLEPYQHVFSATKNRNATVQKSPPGIEWANANPDFWYDPMHSIVVQIKASELVETTKYRTSHSFRFPRVIEIRWDKQPCDTCTLTEFQTFCSSNSKVEKLTKRHATTDDLNKSLLPKRQCKGLVSSTATSSLLAEIEPVDSLCKGLDFCVCVKDGNEWKNMIRRHGGNIVEYPSVKTFVVIAENPKMARVAMLINEKKYNIAKTDWLKRALSSDKPLTKLIKLTRDDMLFATESLEKQFEADNTQHEEDSESQPMVEADKVDEQ